jgi:hypothetical protein
MTHKDSPSLDHIDPLWEEGRNYQLVCGWDCKKNWRELTVGENSRKSNRFLPWRYASDEIGVKPVETGDWVQFLVGFDIENDIPGEWVLMEFESAEWFETTRKYSAEHFGGVKTSSDVEWHRKGGSVSGKNHVERGTGFCSSESRTKGDATRRKNRTGVYDPKVQSAGGTASREQSKGVHAPGVVTFDTRQKGGLKGGKSTSSQKWRCLKTGHITNAGALTRYQRHRDIDTSLRVRVE